MKTKILLFLILIISINVISQIIVDTTKKWNTIAVCPPWSSPTIYTESIVFGQDTTIDMETYKKVMRSTDEFPTNWDVYGFIRETSENKIYYRTDTSSQEYLLYDFSAQENDTLLVCGVQGFMGSGSLYSETLIVDSLDSVFIAGEYRTRINLGSVQWIEGVGSMSGILHNSFGLIGGDGFELLCYSENDIVLYQNTFYASCYQDNTYIEDINNYNILTLYPNPTDSHFYVQLDLLDKSNVELRISDLNGHTKTFVPIKSNKTRINTNNWLLGVYVCGLFIDGRLVRSEKIILK